MIAAQALMILLGVFVIVRTLKKGVFVQVGPRRKYYRRQNPFAYWSIVVVMALATAVLIVIFIHSIFLKK